MITETIISRHDLIKKNRREKMFFEASIEGNIKLHPRFLGHNYRAKVAEQLTKHAEGSYSVHHGYILRITQVERIGTGMVSCDGTGFVTCRVKFQCVVFRTFRGEILHAVVTRVQRFGIHAEAGAAQIFVSHYLFPVEMEFKNVDDIPMYTTADGTIKIKKETEVRLKIIGNRLEVLGIFCVGSMRDQYLGVEPERKL